ncbi:MBL fold metallo-hydrolase [uncultured Arthrobacter sp.]|uniref:MBL fold metallo-hydrolase n=1 Tax=uncultured Arthrobacter sp. TaxID=114050 RepID=UPI0025E9D505|nr:MBL fold metallo-hydrolase [uncultured Arthrobacter sp.]
MAQDLHAVLTGTTPPQVDRLLRRAFLNNPIEASINAFLIDTGRRLILVDTGAGRLFGSGSGGKLVASLAAAGYRPEQINDILITHVHTDHSGGLTDGPRIVFPNATVHAGQPDLDFYLNPANAQTSGIPQRFFDEAQATVGLYARAGKVRGFSGRTQLFPGVVAVPTPGHTPGHAFYRVESREEAIEFWGDIMHFGVVQFPRPAITVRYDVDSPAAAGQRAKQFAAAARDRRRVAVAHVNFPGIGNLRAERGGEYIWVPVEYRDPGAGRPEAQAPR